MRAYLPYCGTAPGPGELVSRFNLDPVLIVALLALGSAQLWLVTQSRPQRTFTLAGWVIAALALMSPLCALSVALFSARVGQHMLLALMAAPLIALGLPAGNQARSETGLWISTVSFCVTLWFWHMPRPYDATFTSVSVYWCMHATLFGSAVWLWRELLHHPRQCTAQALIAGALTSMQMGMLGAMLSLSGRALFRWHLITSWSWGLTPLEDQQLGGVLMWVPGIALFLWAAIRSLALLWTLSNQPRAAHGGGR
jgi:putative membrane protein